MKKVTRRIKQLLDISSAAGNGYCFIMNGNYPQTITAVVYHSAYNLAQSPRAGLALVFKTRVPTISQNSILNVQTVFHHQCQLFETKVLLGRPLGGGGRC